MCNGPEAASLCQRLHAEGVFACGRPAKRVQSEAELREAQWAQEEHQGCCAGACPPTVLIPALILFSDLIGSLASGNTVPSCCTARIKMACITCVHDGSQHFRAHGLSCIRHCSVLAPFKQQCSF